MKFSKLGFLFNMIDELTTALTFSSVCLAAHA
jgi:hypothetical protein